MSLTNKIRRELSFKLAAMAISKHVPAINAAVDELNAKFSAVHIALVDALMPEVPRSRWPELMQQGVLKPTGGLGTDVKSAIELEEGQEGPCRAMSDTLGYATITYSTTHEDVQALINNLGSTRGSSLWFHHFGGSSVYIKFSPRYAQVLPQVDSAADISLYMLHPSRVEGLTTEQRVRLEGLEPLVMEASAVTKKWLEIVVSGLKYREEVYDLLCSCKTRKQLEDVFPEAAKLLAPVAPKRNEVAPAELAANVRRRLVEGVPS